jgi:hypothetical protein
MTILQNIETEFNNALRNKDSNLRGILSALLGEINISAKNDGNRPAVDEDAIKVIRKFIKNLEENITLLSGMKRDISSQEAEISILKKYLPVEITEEEIISFIKESFPGKELNIKDMGMIMGKLKSKYGTALNPAMASKTVKEMING